MMNNNGRSSGTTSWTSFTSVDSSQSSSMDQQSSFQFPSGFTAVQLTDAQLQQLTSHGSIQPLYPVSLSPGPVEPTYTTTEAQRSSQRYYAVPFLVGQSSSSPAATTTISIASSSQPTPAKEDNLQSLVPLTELAHVSEAQPLLPSNQDRHVADLSFSLPPDPPSADVQYSSTHKAQTAAPFHATNMNLVVQNNETLDMETIADHAITNGNDIDVVSFQSNQAENEHLSQIMPQENVEPVTNNSVLEPVRKSERIAKQELEGEFVRPSYAARPYSLQDIWCEECQTTFQFECPEHKVKSFYDRVVLSRAWASLPAQLQIFRLGDASSAELGVFAKKPFPKRIQFGPFVAEHVADRNQLTNPRFPLQVDQDDGSVAFLEASDENKCNWMMFVRPATCYREQNLVAYQFGQGIFFTTIKPIEARQELKVWYAGNYADHIGASVYELTEEDLQALGDEALKWPCYECPKKFRTSMQLQKHLVLHERAAEEAEEGHEASSGDEGMRLLKSGKRKGRLRQRAGKRRGRPSKVKEGTAEEAPFQSWKKKKTNMYLNKIKKYREPIKRSIKTLYKRNSKDSGGNEWVCTHCRLTFDNPSLLNLHTLTHAAENVALGESKGNIAMDSRELQDAEQSEPQLNEVLAPDPVYVMPNAANGPTVANVPPDELQCPVCSKQFAQKQDLIEHASVHATLKGGRVFNPAKPFSCKKCKKSFATEPKLATHLLSHGKEDQKPLKCEVCSRGFMNNSALSCHMKTHSGEKFYSCPICNEGFGQILAMRQHTQTHAVNGIFECPECHKAYSDFHEIRRHMRNCHSNKQFPCPHCDKVLSRPDKYRLHLLKHSNHREFMCETCGKQFKRKDKLREHTVRMHGANAKAPDGSGEYVKGFKPAVSPNDYERFIYKCHQCLLGFKRRGMLVNHLANRHPNVKTESVPELNLPILKAQKDFFCQYCDKVYKSSTKRKQHILKNHPGADLPASSRQRANHEASDNYQPSTFSQTIRSVTTMPHGCQFCHKQYASKAKLLQHMRRHHSSGHDNPQQQHQTAEISAVIIETDPSKLQLDNKQRIMQAYTYLPSGSTVDVTPIVANTQSQSDVIQSADLLTQAMSELTQNVDFRQNLTTVLTPQGHAEIQRLSTLVANGATVEFTPATIGQEQPQFAQLQPPPSSNTDNAVAVAAANQLQILPPASQIVLQDSNSVLRF